MDDGSSTGTASEQNRAELRKQAKQLRTRAKQCMLSHKFADARAYINHGISIWPSYKLYRLRSVAHACMRDYTAALSDADKVIEMVPELSDGYYHKGFALYYLKDYAQAAEAFQEGLRICPTDRVMQQAFWDAVTLLGQSRDVSAAVNTLDLPPWELHGSC